MANLSPWPAETATATRRAALDALRKALGIGVTSAQGNTFDEEDLVLERLASTVSARVEVYAPSAPQQNRDEAVVRGVAWLKDTKGAMSDETVGPLSLKRPSNSASWFLHSGAASLLSTWKTRRAGAI